MTVCGTGGWTGPKPGDPDNNVLLSATTTYGGIKVSWTYPISNSHAVAHTLLFRGVNSDFANASLHATVAGNQYFDKIESDVSTTYYYWIQIVSINGTVADRIGPASALSRSTISELLEKLAGQIDDSALGMSLREALGKITLNYGELLDEIANRTFGDAALSQLLLTVQDDVSGSMALLNQEVLLRAEGQDVLASAIQTLAAVNDANAAAIFDEQTARVTADSAMALDITALYAANTEGSGAAVVELKETKLGYAIVAGSSTPYSGDGTTIVYPLASYPVADFPEYAIDRTRIIDKEGVINWNATAAGLVKPLEWLVGFPLAQAINSVGVSDGEEYLTLEERATAQKLINGDLYGQWTVKIDAGGRVAGIGLSNTSPIAGAGTSHLIVNSDTFSVAPPLSFSQADIPYATVIGQTWFNSGDGNTYVANAVGIGSWVPYTAPRPFIIDTSGQVLNPEFFNSLTYDHVNGDKPPVDATNGMNASELATYGTFLNTTYPADQVALQNQIDGKVESWFQSTDPSTAWTTPALQTQHTGDMWWNSSTKVLQRYSGSAWSGAITDPAATSAAQAASNAQSTADGKMVVFTAQPSNYDVGDLWDTGGSPRMMKRATAASAIYNAGHWATVSDITSQNTAAGIAGQGALATANDVRIGSTVKFADGTTMNTVDFVNKLSKITSANIGTFMSSAAIGTAYIGNAAISSAKIGDAEVGTLKIAGNAATICQSSESAGGTATVTFTLAYAADVQLIGTAVHPTALYIQIKVDGSGVTGNEFIQGTALLAKKVSLAAGSHTFQTVSGGVSASIIVFASIR